MIIFHLGDFGFLPRLSVNRVYDDLEYAYSDHQVVMFNWFGIHVLKFSKVMELRIASLIRKSCDELVSLDQMPILVRDRVREEVLRETQWLRDSQSEQIARRVAAEKRANKAEEELRVLVKSMHIIRDTGKEWNRYRDDGK